MLLDILVVSPHPDDAELGMAGTILKFKAEGRTVGVLDLTSGEPTPFGSPETRIKETAAATAILGLDWRENLNLPNRSLQATLDARADWPASFARRGHDGSSPPIGSTPTPTTRPPPSWSRPPASGPN